MTDIADLDEYNKKRDFKKTTEPGPGTPHSAGGIFVVHKHAASRLHYDFRLEMAGVLKSWAVPKGPSLDPHEKRLAVHVEDHPIEYGSFEGIIPEGEYGGGTVMLWDKGLWQPDGDPEAGYNKGTLKFRLDGQKLKGLWALIRMKGSAGGEPGKENWLLIKERDAEAKPGGGPGNGSDILKQDRSAATGRSMEEIAASPFSAEWNPEIPAEAQSGPAIDPSSITGAILAPAPEFIEPELATLAETAPAGDRWLNEIKYDGYRILAEISEGSVRLMSRNGRDWTDAFQPIASALSGLAVNNALLDGEVVVLRPDGTTSFQDLQNYLELKSGSSLFYFAFDLLYLDGYDLRACALIDRKNALLKLLCSSHGTGRKREGPIRFGDHIAGNGPEFFRQACAHDLEGIISKSASSPYVSGRTGSWLKNKCVRRQEFVVGGYTEPGGARTGFGALLLGLHDDAGKLVFTGRVGTGFNDNALREMSARLIGLESGSPPFANPPTGAEAKGVHWVQPVLVAEVAFSGWTDDGILRQSSFQGLREDKDAVDVGFERTVADTKTTTEPEIVRLTHPDKILFPGIGLTKKELVDYYLLIRGLMLPHLSGRPLTLVRCPEGHDKECFYQKHANPTVPEQVHRIPIDEDGKEELYMMVDSPEGMTALVQMGVLEVHTWGSRMPDFEKPDRVVFDIDPDEGMQWERVAETALLLRNRLAELGLTSFLKTTGGKGLHIVLPLSPERTWDEVKAFTKAVAEDMVRRFPGKVTSMLPKEKRRGKLFIDYMRNMRGATAVEAYSTRAKPGAPIATPIEWDDLVRGIKSDSFTVENIREHLEKRGRDPWDGYHSVTQRITEDVRRELRAA